MTLYLNNNYRISASVLDSDFLNLGGEISRVKNFGIDMLHLDVMDGAFVLNISFGQSIIKKIRAYSDMTLDVHLMIKNPDLRLDSFIDAGADILTVHAEECTHLSWTLNHIKEMGARASVALNPSTSLSCIENVFPYLDVVLIMTVNPGFGGQKFLKEMLPKIARLREMIGNYQQYSNDKRNIDIMVDGGINANTAGEVIKAGANILVLGTAIFKSDNPSAVINTVREKFKWRL